MENLILIVSGFITTLGSGILVYHYPNNKRKIITIGVTVVLILCILFILKTFTISISSSGIVFEKNNKAGELQTYNTNDSNTNKQSSSVGHNEKPTNKLTKENNSMTEANSESQIQSQIMPSTQSEKLDNVVEHQGFLKIRVLCNSQPITFIGTYVSCAQNEQRQFYNTGISQIEIAIRNDSDIALINCLINKERWLLDRFTPELRMPNCNIEINGKIISNNYIVKTDDGESANYKVKLKRLK
jgi:hypothetical protein